MKNYIQYHIATLDLRQEYIYSQYDTHLVFYNGRAFTRLTTNVRHTEPDAINKFRVTVQNYTEI